MSDRLVHVRVMGPPEAVEEVVRLLRDVLPVAEESADYPRRRDLGVRRYLAVLLGDGAATRPGGGVRNRSSHTSGRKGGRRGMADKRASVERDRILRRVPFSADVWTSGPQPEQSPHVGVAIYGRYYGRLYAGDGEVDWLWLQIGDHTRLTGTTAPWEEFAEVLNEALRQRRLYREGIESRESVREPEAQR